MFSYHPKENKIYSKLIEAKKFYNRIFQNFLKNNIKDYSINSKLGAVFVEHFMRTIGNLP